ncbi:MAG TPA: hypothetical protein DF409_03505, partial [Bacteroidales bacterium]|nr:hypothetical protein [Bacteroidales bacterium]
MKYEIDIRYPFEEMAKSKARISAFSNYQRPDRVPVEFCLVPRYFTRQMGIPYKDLFISADKQYELLLYFAKYRCENIQSDELTAPVIYVHPYFDNVTGASHFGGHVEWPENETLQATPTIKSIDDMNNFIIPEPSAGLFGTVIQ